MKNNIFCFLVPLFTAIGMIHAAEHTDLSPIEQFPDIVLSNIAAQLSDSNLARLELASKRLQKYAQTEFKKRPSYWWAKGKITKDIFHAHEGLVAAVFVLDNGDIISVGSQDQKIKAWHKNDTDYQQTGSISYADTPLAITGIAFSAAHNRLVINYSNCYHPRANDKQIISVWDVKNIKKFKEFDATGSMLLTLSPDGVTMATAHQQSNGVIDLRNIITGETKEIKTGYSRRYPGYCGLVQRLAFSSDGKILASVPGSEPIKLWNVETLALEKEFPLKECTVDESVVPRRRFGSFLFLPNGNFVGLDENWHFVGQNPDSILIWNAQTGQQIAALKCEITNADYITGYQLSHDTTLLSEVIGTGSWRNRGKRTGIIWHIQMQKILQEFDTSDIITAQLSFSPDDKTVAAGLFNGDIIVAKASLPQEQTAK